MLEDIKLALNTIESIFEKYPFSKDFLIACLGVIFGGIVTVLINKGAIRKQAYFDMQYKTLNELIDQVHELENSIEHLEVDLSFGDRKTKPFEYEIASVEKQALILNEVFREKRVLIHKYLTGVMLEESAHIPAKIYDIIYDKEKSSLSNPVRKEMLSTADIVNLRELSSYTRKLKNHIIDSLEKLIFPSIISKLNRKAKKIKVACGNIYGIWKVQRIEKKAYNKVSAED